MTELPHEYEWPLLIAPLVSVGIAAVAAIALRGLAPLGVPRRVGAAVCRAAILVLLLFAATGPTWRETSVKRRLLILRNSTGQAGANVRPPATALLAGLQDAAQAGHTVLEFTYGGEADPRATLTDALADAAKQIARDEATEVVLLPNPADLDEELLPMLARLQTPVSVLALQPIPEAAGKAERLDLVHTTCVLVVADDLAEQSPLLGSLAGPGMSAAKTSPDAFPTTAHECAKYDLVVVDNVPNGRFRKEQLAALRESVEQLGVGLVAIGGGSLFAPNEFRDTEFERMLPVSAAEKPPARRRRFATLLVIDKSTSMDEENRMTLAKQAAKQAIEILTPEDQAGILAFGTEAEWISQIGYVADKAKLFQLIDSLVANGKTNLYPAFARAYFALAATDADARHMTLLTDGVPSPADFEQLARRMQQSGITLTTITIGSGADQRIMQDIARAGGGKHFHANRSEDLPEILVRETQSAADAAGALQFSPFVLRKLPGLDVEGLPPLTGFDSTNPKPGAEVLLVGPEGDPLLCWWRLGRGATAAFTSDAGERWAQAWTTEPTYARFWQRIARLAARRPTPANLSWQLAEDGERRHIRLDAIQPGGDYLNQAQVTLLNMPQPLRQIAPGIYEAQLPTNKAEQTAEGFSIRPASGDNIAGRFATAQDKLPQRSTARKSRADWPQRVAQMTGGLVDPTVDQLVSRWREPDIHRVSARDALILAAIVLFVFDVGLRRWPRRSNMPNRVAPAADMRSEVLA